MAFLAWTSKIIKTQKRAEARDETFCGGKGQSYPSFKKRIKLVELGRERQLNFEEKQIFKRL